MFIGHVDDLDFIESMGYCQVVIRDQNTQLIAITKEHRMQTLLEVAFSMNKYVNVDYIGGNPNVLTRVKLNRESLNGYGESKVLTGDVTELLGLAPGGRNLSVTDSSDTLANNLPYDSSKVFNYASRYCNGGNDCPDGSFRLDCTHFICHCLDAARLTITNPSAKCASGLCIRVNDLAEAFSNASKTYDNIKQINSHSATRRGDFCFIPSWFGLSKEHVMLLTDTATNTGAKVYAHSNNRCDVFVNFEGADCVYYRIEN